MTDREKLVALLDEFGIVQGPADKDGYDMDVPPDEADPGAAVTIPTHGSDRQDGYSGFYCRFHFAPDGRFVQVGVWE